MKKKATTERQRIFEQVFRPKLNESIPYSEFQRALAEAGQTVTKRSIQHAFTQWRTDFIPGLKVQKIGRDSVLISEAARTIVAQRRTSHPGIKAMLGAELWKLLFGLDLSRGEHKGELKGFQRHISRKLEALSSKSNFLLTLDAGSTTQAASEQLLKADSFPLRVKTHLEQDHRESLGGVRFVYPTIITNSVAIADMIAKKVEANPLLDLELFLIGGRFRKERGSIVGSLAESCLRSWNLVADISVIGTTGYTSDRSGCPAFACDNISEAQLKAALLSASWFKVVLFDSSKLTDKSVSSVFVPMSYPSVDLIVTDDGELTGRRMEVDRLINEAEFGQVACLVVSRLKAVNPAAAAKDVSSAAH